ncbi:MAG: hypothetical protein HYS81_05440 [Candidatus Aenigmatarchaeota archaeon]|nr:MAG: hypothetical protein HYS81_05440 [Candidatus Aenigmarchaeota archaeon]
MPLKSGWQVDEEVPMAIILFVLVAAVMYYWVPSASTAQKLATALLVSVAAVSLEVILTGKHK